MIIKLTDLENNIAGIYKLNYPNGKIYIGLSNDIKRRMYEHNNVNRLNSHFNSPCDLAIKKYGKFEEIEILEIFNEENKNLMGEREKYWIEYYQSNQKDKGYNLTEGGENATLVGEKSPGAVFSNEQVLDIRKRRFLGERKRDVYQDYSNYSFSTFEHIWLGRGYPNVGEEYLIKTNSKTRQEYSSIANSGENNNKAKLKKEDVLNIRDLFDNQQKTITEISKLYPSVNYNTIRRICKRETWKNI